MLDPKIVRQRDIAYIAATLTGLQDGQECQHWCYEANGWAKITRVGAALVVKLPKVRKAAVMELTAAVEAIVTAHQGAIHG